ncbi:MAG: lysylphosphatidylglycerol synthase transmembrane domain-containing protein [Kofleriaceae bacterium]|nr:lysylphosphatidylglycerol synthase transmembrane domain-containing protein [Kofleriaceae bacterium]
MKIRWGFVLRVLGTVGGLAYIATRVDLGSAKAALTRIPLATFVLASGLVALNVVAGAVRWKVLMRAYGASNIPSLARLIYLYFVAFFYNNFLPGAVVGDVGRGVVTRDAFASEGAAGAIGVVLVERALGLLGLFALLAVGLAATGDALDSRALWWWTVLGSAGSCVLVAGIALARRIAPRLPEALRKHAARLPVLHDVKAFGFATVMSVGTQALIALAGWVLLDALAPIELGASLLVVPLAAATTFLPITVGGAGAREAVYIALCGELFGMAEADAVAASLGLWFAHLVVGALGGLAQLFARRRPTT